MDCQKELIDQDLILVLLNETYAKSIFELIAKNRDYLRNWLPWVDGVNSAEDISQFLERVGEQYRAGNGPNYAIFYKTELAGIIGFHPVDWPNRNAEIGYWIGQEFTGMGLVTRAALLLFGIGFQTLKLNKIEIRCAAENLLSRGVAQRLGMIYEGTLRQEEWLYDHFVDHVVYSMLIDEFTVKRKEAGECDVRKLL